MAKNNNAQQPQPGPIAQQLTKLQSNGHQVVTPPLNAQQPPVKKDKWGFADKTFWEWLKLLIVPIVLAIITFGFSLEQSHISDANSQRQHDTDFQIALDHQQENIMETYLGSMQDLLLNHNLLKSKPGDDGATLARSRTLTALQGLDRNRKGLLVQFLNESGLITGKNPIIDMRNADLKGANLRFAILPNINLSGANLLNADFSGAYLRGARLSAVFTMHSEVVWISSMENVNFSHAALDNANLEGSDLRGDNLSGVTLENVTFEGADLSNVDLHGDNLSTTVLYGVLLNYANLRKATISNEQLSYIASLKGTIMPDGSIHP